jgi:rubredoxin
MAPGYLTPDGASNERRGLRMDRYKCKICGYVYDPVQGDPDGGIQSGTPFAEIRDDWTCPICGALKSEFERIG